MHGQAPPPQTHRASVNLSVFDEQPKVPRRPKEVFNMENRNQNKEREKSSVERENKKTKKINKNPIANNLGERMHFQTKKSLLLKKNVTHNR